MPSCKTNTAYNRKTDKIFLKNYTHQNPPHSKITRQVQEYDITQSKEAILFVYNQTTRRNNAPF